MPEELYTSPGGQGCWGRGPRRSPCPSEGPLLGSVLAAPAPPWLAPLPAGQVVAGRAALPIWTSQRTCGAEPPRAGPGTTRGRWCSPPSRGPRPQATSTPTLGAGHRVRGRRTSQCSQPLDPLVLTQQPVTANLGMPTKDPHLACSPSQLSLPWSQAPECLVSLLGWPAPATPGQLGPSLSTDTALPGSQPVSPHAGEQPSCLDWVGRKVPDEVGGVRVVHHGQHGEGIPGKPKELGQVLWAGQWLAGAELPADRVIGCQEGAGQRPLEAAGGRGVGGRGRGVPQLAGQGASSPPCKNKSWICRNASRTPWAHLGLWPSKSWRKKGCGCRCHSLVRPRGPRTLAHRRDVPEELVGVTEAGHSHNGRTGREGAGHEMGVLDPHVGAEHPPVAGWGTQGGWGTASPVPARSPSSGPTVPPAGPGTSRSLALGPSMGVWLRDKRAGRGPTCHRRRWPGCPGPRGPAAGR